MGWGQRRYAQDDFTHAALGAQPVGRAGRKIAGVFEVKACAESASGPAQDDDSDLVIRVEAAEVGLEVVAHLPAQGIESLRAVEG